MPSAPEPPAVPLAAIGDAAFLYGPGGVVVAATPAAEALAGTPLAGMSAADLLRRLGGRAPGGRPIAPADLPESPALAGVTVPDVTFEITAADGTVRTVLVSASPIVGDGRITGAFSIWRDVTERTRVEKALAESEADARSFMANMVDACAVCETVLDDHGEPVDIRLVEVNPAFSRELCLPAELLVGQTAFMILPALARSWFDLFLEVSRTREPIEVEEPFPALGRWYHVTGFPVRRGRIAVVFRDITERRRNEEVLAESEGRYRSLVENNIDAILLTAPDGSICSANAEASRIFEMTEEELFRAGRNGVVDTSDPRLGPALEERARTGRFRGELRFRRKDGTVFPGEISTSLFTGPDGVARATMTVRDVTDRRRAEDALRASEAKYRRMVDDDITGDFISTPDGRLLECNPTFARMFGFASVEEARSSGIAETYTNPAERETLLDRLRAERRLENDERFRRRRDGTRIHVVENIIGDFDDDGNLLEIRGYIIEDTRRHRAETALLRRERTLRGIFRAAPVGIGMDSRRTITEANDQLCRMTGYVGEELLGQNARMLYPDDESYAYVGREKKDQIVEGGIGAVETQWRRRDGTIFDVLLTFSAVDPSSPCEDVIFIALDITKLHESERALAVYAENLKRSNEELQRFAYVASHDLQEPLRSIVSFSQLLERRYRGRLGEDADDYIGFIVAGGMRMQALIRDLLQLSRIETQAQPPVPTNVGAVVADVVSTLEASICEAGATVTVGPMPTVMADPTQLEQVFTNLIANALKYHREGVPPVIAISVARNGRRWEFAVRDNGIGIEPEYHDRIFQMFQRLHTHDEYDGTGIGLAVVRKIVERHGGRVWVESRPGEGSIFSFTLPAV
ncbi:MAG TPA: PAS domain S-box protein [Methanoregulaceae archaeon]|nr:PAS domain S-box protein [Methanoregulaceae archaeon]